jgi:hypothetical protein
MKFKEYIVEARMKKNLFDNADPFFRKEIVSILGKRDDLYYMKGHFREGVLTKYKGTTGRVGEVYDRPKGKVYTLFEPGGNWIKDKNREVMIFKEDELDKYEYRDESDIQKLGYMI